MLKGSKDRVILDQFEADSQLQDYIITSFFPPKVNLQNGCREINCRSRGRRKRMPVNYLNCRIYNLKIRKRNTDCKLDNSTSETN